MSSSDAKAETNEEAMDSQDGALISLTVTEYQVLIAKITSFEDKHKASDNRILDLEARLDEAQAEIDSLKKSLTRPKNRLSLLKGNTVTWLNVLKWAKQSNLPNGTRLLIKAFTTDAGTWYSTV